MEAQRGFIKDI